jgi:hypothetical protein
LDPSHGLQIWDMHKHSCIIPCYIQIPNPKNISGLHCEIALKKWEALHYEAYHQCENSKIEWDQQLSKKQDIANASQ